MAEAKSKTNTNPRSTENHGCRQDVSALRRSLCQSASAIQCGWFVLADHVRPDSFKRSGENLEQTLGREGRNLWTRFRKRRQAPAGPHLKRHPRIEGRRSDMAGSDPVASRNERSQPSQLARIRRSSRHPLCHENGVRTLPVEANEVTAYRKPLLFRSRPSSGISLTRGYRRTRTLRSTSMLFVVPLETSKLMSLVPRMREPSLSNVTDRNTCW